MNAVYQKIIDIMTERKYTLVVCTGEDEFHFHTPLDEKPPIICDVRTRGDYVEFNFRYVTKRCFSLESGWIGSFYDDEHFNKFEGWFWGLAITLYNYENENKEGGLKWNINSK